MNSDSGIYKIQHVGNGKSYVGSAKNISRRWREHRTHLKTGRHHSQKLQHAWNKYGASSFVFFVLEIVALKDDLFPREQYWINTLDSCKRGYNILPTAGSMEGFKHKPETIEKCRAISTGKKMPEHVKEALRIANIGRKFSEEHRAKLGLASRRKHSAESIEKVAAAHRGMKRSVESRQRMSIANIGNKNGLGFKHSDETKMRISLAKKGSHPAASKLDAKKAEEIRILYANGERKSVIGRRYGVTGQCIGHVVSGKTWGTDSTFHFDASEREAVRYVRPVAKRKVDETTGEILNMEHA